MHEATAIDQGQGACKGSDDHATENKRAKWVTVPSIALSK